LCILNHVHHDFNVDKTSDGGSSVGFVVILDADVEDARTQIPWWVTP
jgi:hypothetical protein